MRALLLSFFLIAPSIASAVGLQNPLKVNSLDEFLLAVIDIVLTFALPFVVLFLMYSGFQIVVASQSRKEDDLKKAKNGFRNVLIGGLVIFGARLILDVITDTIKSIT